MAKYSEGILNMLKQDEGHVGLNDVTRKTAHKNTNSDYGAYYDAKGYLTTGFGSLISKAPKGSLKEVEDTRAWQKRTGLDPFALSEEQASGILPQDVDRVTARARSQLGDVDFDALPEQAQQAIVSLSYNAGQIGDNTAAAIRKAAQSKSTADWQAAAKKFENWHGKNAKDQPAGVLARRKKEASLVASIQGLFPEGSDFFTTLTSIEPDVSVPDGELPDSMVQDVLSNGVETDLSRSKDDAPVGPSPASYTAPLLTEKEKLPPAGAKVEGGRLPLEVPESEQPVPSTGEVKHVDPEGVYTLRSQKAVGPNGSDIGNDGLYDNPERALEGSGFSRIAYDEAKQEYLAEQNRVDRPFMERVEAFKGHLANSFVTENIIGSSIRKGMLVWSVDNDYKNGFDASQLPSFKDEVMGIPPETLKEILDNSYNESMFYGRVANYKAEVEARNQVSAYMADNPISGFVGIGLASAGDVTSLLPVNGIARAVGLTKMARTIPNLARTMGAAIGENLMQDLIQETYLTANSDVRRFDDGDILYGALAGVILGGAAGAFKYSKGLAKYEKLAQRFSEEKNLASLEMLVRQAKKNGYNPSVIANLEQMKQFTEQSLEGVHRAAVLKEVADIQDRIGKGLIDTDKVTMVKAIADNDELVDAAVIAERNRPSPSISYTKERAKTMRARAMEPANELRQQNVELGRRLRQLKANPNIGVEGKRQIKALEESISANKLGIEEINKQLRKQAKGAKAELNNAVRNVKRYGDEAIQDRITMLEEGRKSFNQGLITKHDELKRSILEGTHPELQAVRAIDSINTIIDSLGIEGLSFKTTDELDRFLGMKFEDSIDEFTGPARSGGAAAVEYAGFWKGGSTDKFFNKTDPELWNVMANSAYEAKTNPAMNLGVHQVNKNSTYARILRATRLNELLTNESVVGRWIMNKGAVRSSNNEFASSFYNLFAPDGIGRAGEGRLSVIEKQHQLVNIHGGKLRQDMNEAIKQINDIALTNDGLRQFLGLPENNMGARLVMAEVGWTEKVADSLLRDELITSGTARANFGDEVGDVIEKMATNWDSVSQALLREAKEAGVLGVDELAEGADAAKGWFHRTWDNKAVRQFHAKYGEDKLVELVQTSMLKNAADNGLEITEEMAKVIADQSKKFAFGIFNSDLEVNKAAKLNAQEFMEDLINKNLEGVDTEALQKELGRLQDRAEGAKKRELGKRKPLSLDGAVDITDTDGSTRQFFMKDLLEKNVLYSQKNYIETMGARIAAAQNGIKDIDQLDQWINNAFELEMGRGKVESAQYIKRAMTEDVKAFKYGAAGVSGEFDKGTAALLRMSKKYQFAKLMQYTGISSIAEMGTLIPEAGYKAVSQAITQDLSNVMKSLILGGVTGKEFRNAMYDGLSSITGVGLEDIGYDSLISSSNMIATSKYGQIGERIIDNTAKATRRATSHVEVIGRRLAVNSLALNFGDIALGRARIDSLFGGLSNRNLVELGLASLDDAGKAVPNQKWNNILEQIRTHAIDKSGKRVVESGENITDFNIHKWDLDTRRVFGDALTQQANHILVNPDSTTAKLWHSTPVGSVLNQFRTFANNAATKVAGHNVNQAIQGYKMGSMAEFSKTAQKYFWGAALGKMSLVLYGAIDNAGREDFGERMEKYVHMNDPRDWTRALGRSSAITGLDEVLDTGLGAFGVNPLFNSSTLGQSRNRFDLMSTPTGQMLTDAKRTGEYVIQGTQGKPGAFSKAGKTALKMSPLRRQLGVNQLLNSMGVE